MTRKDIDNIISIICPNDEDFEKPIISPAYLKNELEALALEQEPCTDAISRQAVLMEIDKYLCGVPFEEKGIDEVIKDLPLVIPAEKVGHWISNAEDDLKISEYTCSNCKGLSDEDSDYCPKCGAKMQEVEE